MKIIQIVPSPISIPHHRMDLLLFLLHVMVLTFLASPSTLQSYRTKSFEFGPFNASYYTTFAFSGSASISIGALQLTPDSAHSDYSLSHRYGRVVFPTPFKLFDDASSYVASFNSSFFINIFRVNDSDPHGEGLAFLIAPNIEVPLNSSGKYLGLTNATTDRSSSNRIIAVEFDTFKEDFDPDANHIGLDINSVVSNTTVSLANHDLELAPDGSKFFHVWIQYDGMAKVIKVYMVDDDASYPTKAMPQSPIMSTGLDISRFVSEYSYFGFSASTGDVVELNCVLWWNLTVEELPVSNPGEDTTLIAGAMAGAATSIGLVILGWYFYNKRAKNNDPRILGTLKSLPGTPREFKFGEIKKATNNFDKRNKLGQGGYGVVYRGLLIKENSEFAVKKFSRDSITGKDDFLAELTIINRLRHKHLVKLLGWCHKNGMLLLVYEYMPNGSLDKHLFGGRNNGRTLGWNLRYKIVSGIASALHYLHNEYNQKVLHRDLKPSNIMLDSDFNARLGDFGLARAIDNEMTSYAEIGAAGTIGYIAPECLHTGKASQESDVFGFGAVVLEVVCGRRQWANVGSFNCLADWVWSLHRDGKILDAVDQHLGSDFVVEDAQRLLILGIACLHPIASERPKTQSIVQIISGSVPAPTVPPCKPPFVWPAASSVADIVDTTDGTPMTSSFSGSFIRYG